MDELETLRGKSPQDLWTEDLDLFLEELEVSSSKTMKQIHFILLCILDNDVSGSYLCNKHKQKGSSSGILLNKA